MITTKGPYPWSPVTQISRNGYPSHDCDYKIFEVMISNWPLDTIGSVACSWAASLNQGNHNRSHKLLVKLKSSIRKFHGRHMPWLTFTEYLCHIWPRICYICRNHYPSFNHLWLIYGFVTRVHVTRWVPPVEQDLLALPEHLN